MSNPLGINSTTENINANLKGRATNAIAAIQTEAPAFKPAQVINIDGVPTVIQNPGPSGRTGYMVSDDELRAMGEEPLRFPRCEFPGCDGEGSYQIIAMAGKPLSINRKGELVFGQVEALWSEDMTPEQKVRAQLGISPIVGPSSVRAARLAPKVHVDVCLKHQSLPHAPKPALPPLQMSGPYSGRAQAARRADEVCERAGADVARVVTATSEDGKDAYYVIGDDGLHRRTLKGKLQDAPAGIKR